MRRRKVVGKPGAMVVIISGPSGVGKDTIIRAMMARHPRDDRHFVVTYKTRGPRDDEIHGRDYNFVSNGELTRLIKRGRLLEATPTYGVWSGTPRDQVEDAVTSGHDALLRIDVDGSDKIKAIIPGAVRIFVAPPSMDALQKQLTLRMTESAKELAERMMKDAADMARAAEFDYVVVNETGQQEQTADQIDQIIRSEHERHPDRQITL